jgi:hypothetical protein
MRHRESEIERLTRALERTAAPPCRDYGLGDSEVAGFGGRRGRAAVAQLGRPEAIGLFAEIVPKCSRFGIAERTKPFADELLA